MLNKILTSTLCATVGITAMAQTEASDSITTSELDELVVEAQMQSATPASTTYTPTGRQKNASQNAIDLLRQMAITQIKIDPVNEVVKDNAGSEVAIFINYLAASREEMEGLRTQDVKRVDYLEFPTDPRFRGAQRVINILVQEYAYGGYTKLTTNENVLTGFSSRNNIFSKFSYKKMTYDLYVGANNSNNHHMGSNVAGHYSLKDADGRDYDLIRTETLGGSHYKQNEYPVTLRATYASEKIQIRNTLGYTHSSIPVYDQQGALTYLPGDAQNYTYSRSNPNRSNSLSYQGSFFFSLPKQFSIDFSPRFDYTHSNDYLTYSASNAPEIVRNARENAYYYRVDANLRKRIGRQHSVMLGINGGAYVNRLNYSGSVSYYDRFHNTFVSGILGYNFQSQNVRVYADAGVCREESDINGITNSDIYPFVHLNGQYSPNSRNSLSAFFQFAASSPEINEKVSDVLQDNEYMYVTGNPLLENCRHITLNLSYTWMPSNSFSLSAFNNFFEMIDRQILTYNQFNGGSALIRTYINDGNYIHDDLGVAANCKFFDGKLQLYVSPTQSFYRSTGVYDNSYNPLKVWAQATYYLNNFYFQAYYQTPDKLMFTSEPQIYKSRNYHSLTVGWSNSDWNIRIMAANFFNKGWKGADIITATPLYTEYRENIGTLYHPRLNLTATYTFSYGKKVQRGNEVGQQSGASSAILK